MPNENKKQGSSFLTTTAVAVGIGAIAAVGGYFFGKVAAAEEAEEQRHYERRVNPAATARQFTDDPDDLKKGHDEVRECGICFREFEAVKANNEEIHTTPCGHIFCKHCLEQSLRNKPECPFCRSRVERDQTLRIYI